MSVADILAELKADKIAPVYLLHGEESYFTDRLTRHFEKDMLPEDQQAFNLMVFYGKDSKAQDILDAAQRYPVFAERQVVLLKEANQLRDLEKLVPYIEKPVASTILVLSYKGGKFDARKKLFKAVKKHGVEFESKRLRDRDLPGFLQQWARAHELGMEPAAERMLIDHTGTRLDRLSNELEKLRIHLKAGEKVTPSLVEKYVGISKDFNVFELQNALLRRDARKAHTIARYLRSDPRNNPFVLIMANTHGTYLRLYKYMLDPPVRDHELWRSYGIHSASASAYQQARKLYSREELEGIFSILLEFDLRSKGVGNGQADDGGLLTELIHRLCAPVPVG